MNPFYQTVKNKIQDRKNKESKPEVHLLKVNKVKLNFSGYSEESTPKPALSNDMYTCVGRLKFYPDEMLFMYLEVSINPKIPNAPWPAKATWKIELIDENDSTRKFPLGESTFIFNKPKQGFASHPNDWISVSKDQLESSQLIGLDGSMTIKWSVVAEPALEYVYLEQLEELILQQEINFNRPGFTVGLEKIRQIHNSSEQNTEEISELQGCIKRIKDNWENSVSELKTQLQKHSEQISSLENKVKILNDFLYSEDKMKLLKM